MKTVTAQRLSVRNGFAATLIEVAVAAYAEAESLLLFFYLHQIFPHECVVIIQCLAMVTAEQRTRGVVYTVGPC